MPARHVRRPPTPRAAHCPAARGVRRTRWRTDRSAVRPRRRSPRPGATSPAARGTPVRTGSRARRDPDMSARHRHSWPPVAARPTARRPVRRSPSSGCPRHAASNRHPRRRHGSTATPHERRRCRCRPPPAPPRPRRAASTARAASARRRRCTPPRRPRGWRVRRSRRRGTAPCPRQRGRPATGGWTPPAGRSAPRHRCRGARRRRPAVRGRLGSGPDPRRRRHFRCRTARSGDAGTHTSAARSTVRRRRRHASPRRRRRRTPRPVRASATSLRRGPCASPRP